MSSIKDRQRAAARARLEREMAARAAAARKRRQTYAIIGAGVAVLVFAAGTVWLVTALNSGKHKSSTAAAPASSASAAAPPAPAGTKNCTWNPDPNTGQNPSIKNVGTPPVNVPAKGTKLMNIDTNLGLVQAKLDLSKVPCAAASFAFLASKHFFDGTKCHRLVNEANFKVLQCGDPSAKGAGYRPTDGQGGPGYQYAEENLPQGSSDPYPAGSIAMARTNQPGTTGSQFFIVYGKTQLDPTYTLLGTITKGLDLVQQVGAAGDDGAFKAEAGGGHPKREVDIKSLTVTAG